MTMKVSLSDAYAVLIPIFQTNNSIVLCSYFKPTQSQMSLVVSDIVLKIKRYETVLYTFNIWYLNEINENSD